MAFVEFNSYKLLNQNENIKLNMERLPRLEFRDFI